MFDTDESPTYRPFGAGCKLSDETLAAEALAQELAELAAHLWSGTARFLRLLGELDATEGWGGWGAKSCAAWLSWRCGLSPIAAREHVRVARALRQLPGIAEAFERGVLSYSKVRAISRIATSATEAMLLEWATHGTAAELERVVRSVRLAKSAQDSNSRHKRRFVRSGYDAEGCLVIHASLDPEEGAVVLRALEIAADDIAREETAQVLVDVPAGTSGVPIIPADVTLPDDDPYDLDASTPWDRRRADALCAVAETYLARGPAEISADERALVVIHVDPSSLREPDTQVDEPVTDDARVNGPIADKDVLSRCDLENGPPLSNETARRLACDASLLRVLDRPNVAPITIGRRSRVVPRGMRRALRARDRGCRFPGCDARRVDAHHIRHWAHGGETSTTNLLLLCRRHHRLVHEYGFSVSRLGGAEFEFARPDGRVIEAPAHSVSPGGLTQLNRNAGNHIGPDTYASGGDFRAPNYGLAVEVFLATEARDLRTYPAAANPAAANPNR